jgi:hypothetical protein
MILRKLRSITTTADRWLYLNNFRSAHNLTLPHFIGLGPGQSGSTWLFEQLSRHPDIFLPSKKELNYFNRNLHRYSLSSYAANFKPGGNCITGEISPGYSVLRGDRIQFLKKMIPEVRLILTVRNPVDRSWSAARRLMERFNFNLEDFDDTELMKYFSSEWAYSIKGVKRIWGDFEPGLLEGQYSRIIKHWLRYCTEEQLLVVFFKQLVEEPQTYLETICRHIGANADFKWNQDELHTKINANPDQKITPRFQHILETLYQDEIAWLKQRFGETAI